MNLKEKLYQYLSENFYDLAPSIQSSARYKGRDLGITEESGYTEFEAEIGFIPLEASLEDVLLSLRERGFEVDGPGDYQIDPGFNRPGLRNMHLVWAARVIGDDGECEHAITLGEDPFSEEPTALIADIDLMLLAEIINRGEIVDITLENMLR